MKLKTEKYYLILVGIVLCLLTAVGITINNKIKVDTLDNSLQTWVKNYTVTQMDKRQLVFSHKLEDKIPDNKVIAFNTAHAKASVYADGKLIYSLSPKKDSIMKSPGCLWNFVPITSELQGKTITIHTEYVFNGTVRELTCYYGLKSDIEHLLFAQSTPQILVTLNLLMLGIMLLLYSILVLKRGYAENVLRDLSLFSLLLGLWRFSEIPYVRMCFPNAVVLYVLNYTSLMLMVIPFASFIKVIYPEYKEKLWKFFYGFDLACITLQLLLQIFGIFDFHESLWITHFCVLILIILILYTGLSQLLFYKTTKKFQIQFAYLLCVMVCALINYVVYLFTKYNSIIGAISFLIYIIIMGRDYLKSTRKMIERAKEDDIYRKLAFIDDMTGLYNRNAFYQDVKTLYSTDQTKQLKPVIFMGDLNDLKRCNDTYGHAYGDRYIKMAAKLILNVFDLDSRCYRLGGDEFCILSLDLSINDIELKLDIFKQKIKKINQTPFVVPFDMPIGYAIFDPSKDHDLLETKERADLMMYENKRKVKQVTAES